MQLHKSAAGAHILARLPRYPQCLFHLATDMAARTF